MDLSLTVLTLAGSIALLLWGVHMVQTGVQRAFGSRLRAAFGSALSNRFKAFAAGLCVTAVLQSSTATGLMLTGFAAGGLVELAPGLAVMLGANVGTTLIVQVFSFDVTQAAPLLILVGVMLFRRAGGTVRDFGRVLIGLGLMFMALHDLLQTVTPYEDRPSLRILLGIIATQPLVDVVLAAALTWAAHSSVAIVLLVMSAAAKGVVTPDAAFALALGANLGTALNPCLEGGAGNDPAARRLPVGNLLTRVAGVIVVLPLLGPLGSRIVSIEPNVSRAVADFHTGFNLVLAAVFMATLPGFAALLKHILPSRAAEADPSQPLYLDRSALATPFLALGCATREALRLADLLGNMLAEVAGAIERGERQAIGRAKRVGTTLGKLDGAVTAYLAELDPEGLSPDDRRRAAQVALFATNLGHAADVVERNLLVLAARRLKRGLDLPKAEQETLSIALVRLDNDIRAAATVFVSGDVRAARLLAAEKEAFRDIEARATAEHLGALREGRLDREQGTLFLELLRDMKRVNMHLVSAGAYPVLEGEGELLPTRLRHGLAIADHSAESDEDMD